MEQYTTPSRVYALARKYYGPNVEIKQSTRRDKKYMMLNPHTDKWFHFGQMGYEDYTKHNDPKRREAYRIRNKKWSKQSPYTPGYASYYLLW